ncbi:hypothetical protein SAMN06265379_103363 [Saccharicrinis carchari]|uniref:Uncharacterized protein n=1 Tax=Saccharicrinis carchari TaxID=1168039 RepID=A0A521CP37_SACCC|nr:hypothetical protein SAMN06265379_103363 [Saccharicrinis carchari]
MIIRKNASLLKGKGQSLICDTCYLHPTIFLTFTDEICTLSLIQLFKFFYFIQHGLQYHIIGNLHAFGCQSANVANRRINIIVDYSV